ncbi:hypothetical protein Purlil1_12385 [Purpureocillium lilacinum]|uniref:Uncharacterized protein n=1 Tax=Purpureocillium lilacinum TaxID=33203 RepID=A0ABR0BHA8_PURLI|nr:hypothetical protein Purlil1_12385 [Purpureocillium lilacinum]
MRRLKMYFLLLSGLARFAAALPNALNLRETSQILPLSVHWDLRAEEASVICSTPSVNMTTFGAVTSYGLEQAISYLANLDGQPRMNAGPASCSQVSCAYATSVYLCNDAKSSRTLETWTVVADAVKAIHERCGMYALAEQPLGGQIFYKEDWNVILRSSWC